MLCKLPFQKDGLLFGCGQCLPCRISRRRVWSHRMCLESLMHSDSAFVTLTYAPEHLPFKNSLVPKHAQDWVKRLRRRMEPRKIRFFLVGEYGDSSGRPHYHAAIFGLSPLQWDLVQSSWGLGYTHVGDLSWDSAQYIAGYVTKKMTAKDDPRLQGRHPEFARMSLRPGIGAHYMEEVAKTLQTEFGCDLVSSVGDVPSSLNHGVSSRPLGRYLRQQLRKRCGDEEVFKKTSVKFTLQMQQLREAFASVTGVSSFTKDSRAARDDAFKAFVVEQHHQKRLNQESRFKVKGKRGSL